MKPLHGHRRKKTPREKRYLHVYTSDQLYAYLDYDTNATKIATLVQVTYVVRNFQTAALAISIPQL